MTDSEARFLKVEMQLNFLETAMADTAFVVSHLLKNLPEEAVADVQRRNLQAGEHELRTLLHQIRASARQEIETEEQARAGQQLYQALLRDFEAATQRFYAQAAALAASLPPPEQTEMQSSLEVLRDFQEGFSSLG